MTELLPLLLQTLAAGSLRIELGKIDGRCGYRDERARAVALNPDATPEELAHELADHLRALAVVETTSDGPEPMPTGRPALTLVQPDDRAADHTAHHRHARVVI